MKEHISEVSSQVFGNVTVYANSSFFFPKYWYNQFTIKMQYLL